MHKPPPIHMEAGNSLSPSEAGDPGVGPHAGMGYAGRLRDAGWEPVYERGEGPWAPARTQVLHPWPLLAGQGAAGLVFRPLDGNPRHGVLALYAAGRGELQGAIEILERQGRWLVMPDRVRARSLAAAALLRLGETAALRSRITGTPDRRFIFFNTLLDGTTTTLVERRRNGDATLP